MPLLEREESAKPQVDFPIGDRREKKRLGESALENSLAQATKMAEALLKKPNNLTLQMKLRRLLTSINRTLQTVLSRGVADPTKKAHINSLIARKNFIEYSILPKSRQVESFDDMLSTVMKAGESCGPTFYGGHPAQEDACLKIAIKLLIEAGRVKEALPLSRKLKSRSDPKPVGPTSLAVKYHMAVIQLYLLDIEGGQVEPGFLKRGVEVYTVFEESEESSLREYARLYEWLGLNGDEFGTRYPLEDWPGEMGHWSSRHAATLGLYLWWFLDEERAGKDQKWAVDFAFNILHILRAAGLYQDLCELCNPLVLSAFRQGKSALEEIRRPLLLLEESVGTLQFGGLISSAVAKLDELIDSGEG